MALNIKDPETERLAAEAATLLGQTKTGAIRHALRDLIDRHAAVDDVEHREASLQRFLETEIWPLMPEDELGSRLSKEEQEEILGFGPDGV
jgi:antitoxin VapB